MCLALQIMGENHMILNWYAFSSMSPLNSILIHREVLWEAWVREKSSTYDLSCDTRSKTSKESRYQSTAASVRLGTYSFSWAVIQIYLSMGNDGIIFRASLETENCPWNTTYHTPTHLVGDDIKVWVRHWDVSAVKNSVRRKQSLRSTWLVQVRG